METDRQGRSVDVLELGNKGIVCTEMGMACICPQELGCWDTSWIIMVFGGPVPLVTLDSIAMGDLSRAICNHLYRK